MTTKQYPVNRILGVTVEVDPAGGPTFIRWPNGRIDKVHRSVIISPQQYAILHGYRPTIKWGIL